MDLSDLEAYNKHTAKKRAIFFLLVSILGSVAALWAVGWTA